MSRGESYGGGQSSLGYLFGSKEGQPAINPPPSPSRAIIPPYGTDLEEAEKPHPHPNSAGAASPEKLLDSPNNNRGLQGQNSRNFITDRPSTKVNSVPGGSSSLGYLFGDK